MKFHATPESAEDYAAKTGAKMRIALLYLVVVLLPIGPKAPPAAAQETTSVKIVDVTPDPASPVAISGDLSVTENVQDQQICVSFKGSIDARNTSQKPILALLAEINLNSFYAPFSRIEVRDDRFFKSRLIAPEDVEEIFQADSRNTCTIEGRGLTPAGSPEGATAKVRVAYVEFEDGSQFRTPADDHLFANRRSSLWALRQLERTYETSGEEGFEASLKDAPPFDPALFVVSRLSVIAQNYGAQEAVSEMQEMLKAANAREDVLVGH